MSKFGYDIIRKTLTLPASQFVLIASLPKNTVIWRIKNTDPTTTVYVSIDRESPTVVDGETSVIVLEPKQSDSPPIIPALLCRPVSLYVARATTATQPIVEIIYTTSSDAKTMMAVVAGPTSTAGAGAVSVSGNVVGISGQFVSISGGVVTSVSGNVVNVSGSAVTASGTTVYTANPVRPLVFSGTVSWGSGNASGGYQTITIAPPSTFGQDDVVVVGLFHAALSADVTLIAEKTMPFGSSVFNLELTRFVQNRGTSGVAQPIRGLFAGNTSGRLTLMHNQTAVENITGNVNVWQV